MAAAAVRLDERRLACLEAAFEARLECGDARSLVPELEHLVAEQPLREGLRALLMLALQLSPEQFTVTLLMSTDTELLAGPVTVPNPTSVCPPGRTPAGRWRVTQ